MNMTCETGSVLGYITDVLLILDKRDEKNSCSVTLTYVN